MNYIDNTLILLTQEIEQQYKQLLKLGKNPLFKALIFNKIDAINNRIRNLFKLNKKLQKMGVI